MTREPGVDKGKEGFREIDKGNRGVDNGKGGFGPIDKGKESF
jgi:hypothetical protein